MVVMPVLSYGSGVPGGSWDRQMPSTMTPSQPVCTYLSGVLC